MEQKKRHWCLTVWLICMIIGNAATGLMYLFLLLRGHRIPTLPDKLIAALPVVGLFFNVVCVVALFRWKKWGFWGLCATTLIVLIINLSAGTEIGFSLLGVMGVAIVYGILHLGKENKGWPQLD